MRKFILGSAVVAGIALPGTAIQTRTESVLLGELRQNQEQLKRLTALVGQLTDRLDGLDRRMADHQETTTKTLADQHLLIGQLSISTQTMREDGALRATQTTQEISAVREGVRLLADRVSQLAARSAAADPAGAPSGVAAMPIVLSPDVLMDPAMGDILADRYDLAIEGFKEVIKTFPTSPAAAKAQFYIGEAHNRMSRPLEAIAAYDKTIADYKDSEFAREAMYMKGVTLLDTLKNPAQARVAWDLLIKQAPNSDQASRARERLKAMKGGHQVRP